MENINVNKHLFEEKNSDLTFKNRLTKTNKLESAIIYSFFIFAYYEIFLRSILGSFFRYYLIFSIVALILINKKFSFKKYHFFIFSWLLYLFLSTLWTPNLEVFQNEFLSQFSVVIMFIILTSIKTDKKRLDNIFRIIWINSFIIALLSLFFNEQYFYLEDRIVLSLFGYKIDPNYQAILVLFGIALSFTYLLNDKNKILSIIFSIVGIFSLFLTGSRGGFIALLIISIISLILYIKNNLTVKKIGQFILIIFTLSISLYIFVFNFFPENIFERIFLISGYGDGSSRINLWNNAFLLLKENFNLIFGAGWGAFFHYNDANLAVHNTYLSVMSDTGIIGFCLLFIPIFIVFYKSIKNKDYLVIMLNISLMIPILFVSLEHTKIFWIPIIILFLNHNIKNKENEIEKLNYV